MPELDTETRAEIAKLCVAASNIRLRLAADSSLLPAQFDELSTVLSIGINRVRVHYGLPSGWSPEEEWQIMAAHGDLTSGGNQGMVEPVPPTEAPRRRLFGR